MNPIARSSAAIGSSSRPNVSARWKTHLGVGRPLDVGEQPRVDGEHEVAPQRVEVVDDAVVDEQPAAVAERVAVGLLDRRARSSRARARGTAATRCAREVAQVRVAPGRRDAAVDARARRPCRTSRARSRRRSSSPRPSASAGSGRSVRAGVLKSSSSMSTGCPATPSSDTCRLLGRGRSLRRPPWRGQPSGAWSRPRRCMTATMIAPTIRPRTAEAPVLVSQAPTPPSASSASSSRWWTSS